MVIRVFYEEGDNESTLFDYVRCFNCENTMLVPIGTDVCPVCDVETLYWVDNNIQEVRLRDIIATAMENDDIIVIKRFQEDRNI